MSEILRIAGLWKSFGRKRVLEDVSFSLEAGQVVGLVGRNGEGKTTLARILMGAIPGDRGEIIFKGKPAGFKATAYKSEIGYIPEDPFFYGWMSAGELIRFHRSFHPRWNAARVEDLLDELSIDPKARIRTMSRGEKLKLALVAAVGSGPDLLVLDDPTSGLDVPTRRDFLRDIIRELSDRGTAVLFATHLVHELERVADRIVILHGHRVVLDREVQDVKGHTRRARLVFEGEAPAWPDVPGTLSWWKSGARLEAVVYPWNGAAEKKARELSPVRLEVEALSLEEFFVQIVSPEGPRPGTGT